MKSRTIHLPEGENPRDLLLAATEDAGRAPDLALAFLPPEEELRATLAALTSAWPDTVRCGCEAATQIGDQGLTRHGILQAFWFDQPHHHISIDVVPGTFGEPPSCKRVEAVARRIAGSDGALVLGDGLRFPTERFLGDLRRSLATMPPWIAGGLASQDEPVTRAGARVFLGDRVLPAACLVATLHGFSMQVEVVRGFSPASPVYKVTRSQGPVVQEIDGGPATEWYRRFFLVEGELAPLPASARRFPLIIEGPSPERQGLFRSLKSFDEPSGTVTFWGEIETGDQIRLAIGSGDALAETAAGLAGGPAPEAALLCSCAWRGEAVHTEAAHEVALLRERLGNAALSGFFTFGEIGPTHRGNVAYFNQTTVLVLLSEEPT